MVAKIATASIFLVSLPLYIPPAISTVAIKGSSYILPKTVAAPYNPVNYLTLSIRMYTIVFVNVFGNKETLLETKSICLRADLSVIHDLNAVTFPICALIVKSADKPQQRKYQASG